MRRKNNPDLPANSLGQRLRRERLRQGMSQEDLAQPQFTKSYVSAIERGKARPSLKALEFLAARLAIPPTELLSAPLAPLPSPDAAALNEDLAFQLDCARRAIDTDQAADGLRQLNAIDQHGIVWPKIDPELGFRFYYLRALAYIRLAEPAAAHHELAQARPFAARLNDGGAARVRVLNLIGGAYYQQDLPGAAARAHEECLAELQKGAIDDHNLRLLVYSNLANDCLALGQVARTISLYREALGLLDNVSNLERQSGIYWGLALAYKRGDNLALAKLYAGRALNIYEALQNMTAVGQMSVNMADILTQRSEFGEAEASLARARALLGHSENPVAQCMILHSSATLELKRGHLEEARGYAQHGLALAESYLTEAAAPRVELTQAHLLMVTVELLTTAGRIAEEQGDRGSADSYFQRAVTQAQQAGAWGSAAESAESYARLLTARGMHQEAGFYYQIALRPQPHNMRH